MTAPLIDHPLDPICPEPRRFLVEPEFWDEGFYPQYEPTLIEPLAAADYPTLEPGDLAITRHRGTFARLCPATPVYNCCGLNIIHIGQGCHLGCHYCVLAAYLGSEAVIRFGNLDTALTELEAILSSIEKSDPESGQDGSSWPEDRSYRFCTGEFTDSLIYEEGLGISARLIELFRSSTKCYLELKTKTADLGPLLKLDHGGRTVISFSLNAPFIAQNHEPKAAPLIKRLQAAQAAAAAGYPLGFHFDPIVHYKDWRSGYGQTIELLDQYVPWDRIAWISLGCFRYLGPLKNAQLAKNPSSLFDAEFIRALDGKFRYPRPLRRLLYEGLLDLLKPRLDPRTTVYFCMESPRMWRDLLGFDPQTSQLTARFRKPFLTEPWTMRSSADPDFQP